MHEGERVGAARGVAGQVGGGGADRGRGVAGERDDEAEGGRALVEVGERGAGAGGRGVDGEGGAGLDGAAEGGARGGAGGRGGREVDEDGAAGAALSWTKVLPLEQVEVLPALSVAVAKKVVARFGWTLTLIAKAPGLSARVAATGPWQSGSV
ncbi:MAG: hypothetical protein U1F43_21670 [Myxococcota bacterium]